MKIKICVFLCFLVLLFSGCSWELVSPDSLVTAPSSNQEKLQQRQMITSFLGREESLIVPSGSAEAYQYIDLDQDGEDEIVAFYADQESNFMLGFLVLDQNDGQWFLKHKAIAYGTGIHYFTARDLDKDGHMELLLGVRTGYGSQKELYLYHLNESEMVDITSSDRITYDQIALAHNSAQQDLLVIARTDTTILVGSSNIIVYGYQNQDIYSVYEETFDGYCSEIAFSQVGKEQDGIYLAMQHNHFVTILLLQETEEGFAALLEHTLPYDYEDLSTVTLFADENSDGILEVNSLWEPEENAPGKSYQDFIQVWLQWDGADGFQAVDAILNGAAEGYRFMVPLEWLDSLYYNFRSEDAISWIDFYYEDESLEFAPVFSLAAIDQLVWKSMEAPESVVVLGNHPTKNKIYVADLHCSTFHGFAVTASKLTACLQIEGGERK